MSRPLAIDLFTGLHGWAEGLIAAGWHVIGFDLEDMSKVVGEPLPPEHFSLVLQDVLTLHGSQFKDAELIVGSSPCQEFSYRAMPWKRAKALGPPEFGMKLFEAQFRIQREACEAGGRYIPLVVENVKGAQPWVGRARWHYGSYFLWGDVPALMPVQRYHQRLKVKVGEQWNINHPNFTGTRGWDDSLKNTGGSWFNIAHNTTSGHGRNPVAGKADNPVRGTDICGLRHDAEGIKQGGSWFHDNEAPSRKFSSKSPARKAASAKIAKIPFTLAHWIGRAWFPRERQAV